MTERLPLPVPEYLAFGDISVDVAVRLSHLPRPDEKMWAEVVGENPGGMAANAAAAVAALGGRAGVVALVGDDRYGRTSLEDLQERGVDLRFVDIISASTFWTLALLAEDGEKCLIEFHTPAIQANWKGFDWSVLAEVKCVHAIADGDDWNLRLFKEARAVGGLTSLDLEGDVSRRTHLAETLRLTDMLFVNAAAAASLDPDPWKAIRRFHEMGAATVVLTRGAGGCLLLDRSGREHALPGHVVSVKDTTGAGDCFAGAFAFARLRGWSDLECAELANLMAAMSTTALGSRGALLSASELSRLARQKGYNWWQRLL